MAAVTRTNFFNLSGAVIAALVLWLPVQFIYSKPTTKLLFNTLALGAALYGCVESGKLKQKRLFTRLNAEVEAELAEDFVELEYARRKAAMQQRYGILPIVETPQQVALPAAEEVWQPVNPFAISNEAARLMTALAEFNLSAEHLGQIQGARITRHKLKPGKGVSTKKIKALADDLKVALSLPVAPVISEQAGYLAVDIPGEQKIINFAEYITPEQRPNDSPVMLALGVDVLGELVEGNVSDPDYCHGLGAGKTGSGKTEAIIAMTLSLTQRYSPDLVKFVIHTMKAQDFRQPFFQGNPWQWRATTRNPLEALELVKDLVTEMRGRNQFLADNASKNIDEHNRKFPDAPMAHILFHFDECGGTMLALKQLDRDNADEKDANGKSMKTSYFAEMSDNLKALAKEARAAGVHLFCWDQKPSEKALDTDIRSELGLRVCLKVQDPEASKMVIGVGDADQLLGKGDMLALIDGQLQRLQGLFVTPELLEADPAWQPAEATSPRAAPAPKPPAPTSTAESKPVTSGRFSPEYTEFINSPEWRAKRAERIKLDTVNGRVICQICGRPCTESDPAEVDHFRYPPKGSPIQAFIDQPLDDLRTVHKSCHKFKTKRSRQP